MVKFKPGCLAGERLEGNPTTAIRGLRGDDGCSPALPEMRSAYFAAGNGIGRPDLGVIDLRQIAPTLVRFLGVAFPTATAQPIDLLPWRRADRSSAT